MLNMQKKNYWLDFIGLFLIGSFSLLYVLFYKYFAEQHVQLPFLNFPIFVGEILLFTCLLLFLAKYLKDRPKLNKWHYVIIAYFAFVLAKALFGYIKWGPLALRHSALFYYPAFAVFSYAFYRRKFLSSQVSLFLVLIIMAIFVYGEYYGYYLVTLTFLGFILIKSYPNKRMKIFVLLAFLVFIPYRYFFITSRMMVVSNFVTSVYLAAMLPFILGGKRKVKLTVMGVIIGIVLLGLFKFADLNLLKSIVDFRRMARMMQYYSGKTDEYRDIFKFKPRPEIKIYNPDIAVRGQLVMKDGDDSGKQSLDKPGKQGVGGSGKRNRENQKAKEEVALDVEKLQKLKETHLKPISEVMTEKVVNQFNRQGIDYRIKLVDDEDRIGMILTAISVAVAEELDKIEKESEQTAEDGQSQLDLGLMMSTSIEMRREISRFIYQEVLEDLQKDEEQSEFDETEYYNNNAVFRLLIWKDMADEMFKEKPVVGFDFGKPFRSITLELFRWGEGDWRRDGWIGAHNSHLHIIYRAGIIGILRISAYVYLLFKMILRFVRRKLLTGILLCGIIINWFVAANFLLILELPYTAIPIWTLFGLTYAYYHKKEGMENN